jgi:dipeptidyl-peptidase-4
MAALHAWPRATATLAALLLFACEPEPQPPPPAAAEQPMTPEVPEQAAPPAPQPPADDRPALTTEAIAEYPLPGTLAPSAIRWSPDDRRITYLRSPDRSLTQQLYLFDPDTGEEQLLLAAPGGGETEDNLSPEEKLRRERARARNLGITRYAWTHHSAAEPRILVPLTGGIYIIDDPTPGRAQLRELVAPSAAPALDPRLSRDGQWVAYVQDAELYVVPVAGGAPRQLTSGARGSGRTHGLAEYIAQEEMARSEGYWWSHDAAYLAYTQVDETHIPAYRIVHQGKDQVGPAAQEDHAYPFAGQANARVRLGVIPRAGGRTVWMDLEGAEYLARVHWTPQGDLLAELQDRKQSVLRLVRFDLRSGRPQELLRETSDVWINLHRDLRPLESTEGDAAGGFLWAAERDGFHHLYLYDRDGRLLRQLTQGTWPVDNLVSVDEEAGLVYFVAGRESPLERHLYAVPLAGGEPRRLTRTAGAHSVALDNAHRRFVDVFSDPQRPPALTVRELADGAALTAIPVPDDPRLADLPMVTPELVTLRSRDGAELHGALYRPPAGAGPGPYPTLISVYGGPHAQRVTREWGLRVDMRAQFLASQGYLVFKLDGRGSARRGLAFEGAIRHNLGDLEIQDQVDGVRWLVAEGLSDPARVGIYGWSYGGYAAAMALARAPETFKVAIAGAPVTHWDGYDTHYTERYMGLPADDPEAYQRSSVLAHVDGITGHLLLVHGLIDENVHFRHSARLINAMIRARKAYQLLLFPDERHMPRRREDRIHMEDQIFAFIREKL